MEGSALSYFTEKVEILNNHFENNIGSKGSDYVAALVKNYSLVKNCTFVNF